MGRAFWCTFHTILHSPLACRLISKYTNDNDDDDAEGLNIEVGAKK